MRSSININLTTDKILIRLNEKCEHKEIMAALKNKVIELKKLYQDEKFRDGRYSRFNSKRN